VRVIGGRGVDLVVHLVSQPPKAKAGNASGGAQGEPVEVGRVDDVRDGSAEGAGDEQG